MSEITWIQLTTEEQSVLKSIKASRTLSYAWLNDAYTAAAESLLVLGLVYTPKSVNTTTYMLTDAGRALVESTDHIGDTQADDLIDERMDAPPLATYNTIIRIKAVGDEPADTLDSLRAELDALKASNAELRASADEAQAARLAAAAEVATLRARVEALEAAARAVIDDCRAGGVEPFHLDDLRAALKGEA